LNFLRDMQLSVWNDTHVKGQRCAPSPFDFDGLSAAAGHAVDGHDVGWHPGHGQSKIVPVVHPKLAAIGLGIV